MILKSDYVNVDKMSYNFKAHLFIYFFALTFSAARLTGVDDQQVRSRLELWLGGGGCVPKEAHRGRRSERE